MSIHNLHLNTEVSIPERVTVDKTGGTWARSEVAGERATESNRLAFDDLKHLASWGVFMFMSVKMSAGSWVVLC